MSIDAEPEIIFKWTNLCRLCLSSDSHIDLFSTELISQDCLFKIRNCLNLLVYQGDPMPKKLCSKCHMKLDEWYRFRKECIENETNVKQRLHCYRDLKFVKEYFERCARFESSEIVSSSSKINSNSIQSFEEANSSIPTQECLEECYDREGSKKINDSPFYLNKSEGFEIAKSYLDTGAVTSNLSIDGTLKQKSNSYKEIPGDQVKQEHLKRYSDWFESNEGLLGTIVSVTGSASAIWDTQYHGKLSEEPNYYYCDVDNFHEKDKVSQYNNFFNSQENKVCGNCGLTFATDEEFEVHTCCMIDSSTHLEDSDGQFENSISPNSACSETENFTLKGVIQSLKPIKITPWKCIACNLYFDSRTLLKKHYSSVTCLGKKLKALDCEFCYRQFLSLNDLLEHQVTHIVIDIELTEDDLICCNHCSLQFPNEKRLKNHLLIHTLKRKIPIKYTCSSCSQVFFNKEIYESHLLTHMKMEIDTEPATESVPLEEKASSSDPSGTDGPTLPKEEPKKQGVVRCFRCGQVFASVKQLQYHESTKHKNPTPFICRKCGLRFSARSQLLMHLRVHMSKSGSKNSPNSEKNEQANSCSKCDAKFLLESDLESHMKTHKFPTPEPPSPTSVQNSNIEENANNSDMFANFKCSLCSRLYVRATSCIRHGQQSHKGQKVVPLKLKQSVYLGKRTSLPVGGKVKHKCPKCPKYFFSFNAYSIHAYRNHGVKLQNPFDDSGSFETEEAPESPKPDDVESKCPFCAKDIKPSYISLHIKKFHRGEVLDPTVIGKDIPTDSCICRYCFKTCSTPHNRKLHESIHYPVRAQRNQCETCGQKFPDKELYDDHVRTCKSIRCGKCNKIFFKFITLAQHSCSGTKNDEAHKCTVCLSAFTSLDLLQIHIKNFHGKKTDPSVSEPGTSKNAVKRLERALWREESNKIVCRVGEKFYCTFCDCEFSSIKESNEHRSIHPRGNWYAVQISDSLFQCTICDKFFETRKSSLLHINYHKKNLLPEQPKPFQISLEPEVEIFTGTKPPETTKTKKYNCRFCGAGFKDEDDLQNHLFHTHVNQT